MIDNSTWSGCLALERALKTCSLAAPSSYYMTHFGSCEIAIKDFTSTPSPACFLETWMCTSSLLNNDESDSMLLVTSSQFVGRYQDLPGFIYCLYQAPMPVFGCVEHSTLICRTNANYGSWYHRVNIDSQQRREKKPRKQYHVPLS